MAIGPASAPFGLGEVVVVRVIGPTPASYAEGRKVLTRMRETFSLIEASMAEGKGVCMDRWGGAGPNRTVMGCCLAEQGRDEGAPIGRRH